jgi:Phosphotransferase enzyme family
VTGNSGRLPRDPALPGMAKLLEPATMAAVLARSLGAPTAPEVRISYLRYKPHTNLVVHYRVAVPSHWHHASAMIASRDFLARRARKPEHLTLARAVNGRSPSPAPLSYDPDLRAMIQWLPLDISLPALARPVPALRERLRSAGLTVAVDGREPGLLAYKPRRRAVLRLDDHVLKLYARDSEFRTAVGGLRAASASGAFPTAPLQAVLPDLRLTAQGFLRGGPADGDAPVPAVGRLIAAVHGSAIDRLPVARPAHQLAAAAASARLAGVIVPSLERRLARLMRGLAEKQPRAGGLVPSHGDFSPRQVLQLDGGRLAVVDFDAGCMAPAALDLATYASYFMRDAARDLETAEQAMTILLDGYGCPPPALAWYLSAAILRRAPRPFRRLEDRWPERVEAMVAAAESVLSG